MFKEFIGNTSESSKILPTCSLKKRWHLYLSISVRGRQEVWSDKHPWPVCSYQHILHRKTRYKNSRSTWRDLLIYCVHNYYFVSGVLITYFPFVLQPWGDLFFINTGQIYEHYIQTNKLGSLTWEFIPLPFPPWLIIAVFSKWYRFYGDRHQSIHQNRGLCEFTHAYYETPY